MTAAVVIGAALATRRVLRAATLGIAELLITQWVQDTSMMWLKIARNLLAGNLGGMSRR